MTFETEVFISYAHLDNQSATKRHEWVTNFHRELEIRVGQLLGKAPEIWRDPKVRGNDDLTETLLDRIKGTAVLVSILTPRYLKSEWTKRELEEFCRVAEKTGGLTIREKSRVFKVIKTPVRPELEIPPLPLFVGYEFFKYDSNGIPQELDDPGGHEFRTRVNDLAHDICPLLESLESDPSEQLAPPGETRIIYLAETTFDLKAERDAIERDLKQHGHTVLPSRSPLPLVASELAAFVREELTRSDLSIHLVGKTYSLVPEGGKESLLEMQDELGTERAERGNFARLVWIPPGLQVEDERQQAFIQNLRMNPRIQSTAELLETSLEDFKTLIHERLKPKPAETQAEPCRTAAVDTKQIYFIFDQQDQEAILPWQEFLFASGFDVMCSLFEGDEAEIRELHEEKLRTADGVLIHYGAGNQSWFERKLNELLKSKAGRTKPPAVVGVSVAPPITPNKRIFRHDIVVISQLEGFAPGPFDPFLNRLKAEDGGGMAARV